MSNPERLVFTRTLGVVEELNVTVYEGDADARRAVATPRPADLAYVLGGVSDEWFEEFLLELSKLCPHGRGTALVMAATPSEDSLAADVAGGDVDPGFGVDPEDSARLLELRNAIDENFGWANQEDQERGDYVARVNEVGSKLYKLVNPLPGATDDRIERLEKQLRTQRAELRRFNREARARKEGNVPLHVTQDRWLSKLHALEQKTALGTATQADLHAIMRFKRWLGDNP